MHGKNSCSGDSLTGKLDSLLKHKLVSVKPMGKTVVSNLKKATFYYFGCSFDVKCIVKCLKRRQRLNRDASHQPVVNS